MTHPYPVGTSIRLIPQRGTIVDVRPYRIGRTKATAEIHYSYLVAWEDGSRDSISARDLEIIDDDLQERGKDE